MTSETQKKDQSATNSYTVLKDCRIGGQQKAKDDKVELTPKAAKYLLLEGKIAETKCASSKPANSKKAEG